MLEATVSLIRKNLGQIAVTALVLSVFLLARHIPGMFSDILRNLFAQQVDLKPYSIVPFGAYPWVVATALTGLLFAMRFRRLSKDAQLWSRNLPYHPITIAIFILTTIVMALPVLGSVLAEPPDYNPPEILSMLPSLITVTAGSLLVVFLARIVDEKGVGFGFWIFALVPAFIDFPDTMTSLWESFLDPSVSRFQIIAYLVGFPALVALSILLVLGFQRSRPSETPQILLASLVASTIPGFLTHSAIPLIMPELTSQPVVDVLSSWQAGLESLLFLMCVFGFFQNKLQALIVGAAGAAYLYTCQFMSMMEINWFTFTLFEAVVLSLISGHLLDLMKNTQIEHTQQQGIR
jgi:preprotein translocase subunit SecY